MFDNKQQMMLNSTNPKGRLHLFYFRIRFYLLYKTFDQQIEAFLQMHSTNNVKIHKNLRKKQNIPIQTSFESYSLLPNNKKRLPGIIELNKTDINIGNVI